MNYASRRRLVLATKIGVKRIHPLNITIVLLMLVIFPRPGFARDYTAVAPAGCLKCHGAGLGISAAEFAASAHGPDGCTSCHLGITDLTAHERGKSRPLPVKCVLCHSDVSARYAGSVHNSNDIACDDCHSDIHTLRLWKGDKREVVKICVQCHDTGHAYRKSIHGRAVFAGNQDAAVCSDCHGLHRIVSLGDPRSFTNRKFHTMVCLKCHADKEMMKRNGVMTVAVPTFFESYHGKGYRLGFPEKVAGCADCHTAHSILPQSDPDSSVNPRHLVKTCSQCHTHVTPLFTRFYPHADENDREHYPVLYWTYRGMRGLLVGVFVVFGIHTLFWLFRGFVENRQKKIALVEGRYHAIPGGYRIFRRFRRIHIFLHLLVITSFLGLALTGLPLYFAGHHWAKIMMDYYGGPSNSGFIHRICAVITFFYFFSAVLLSIHFLFIRRDIKGSWLKRLLGPDSLFINGRDFRDAAGMAKWFLFLGPKPSFERWTYWEKFDFFAVFWGMFAIGGTGLLLWFPSFFDSFLPGWMFNVATIIHSDEALLATGFIFAIHFFNTHGRPEKFPMDFVIFNGEINKEEFVTERGDQWERLQREGMTERIIKPRPSRALYDFIFKCFGFLALFTGMTLLLLMAYAFLTHQ
jgi:hypothetical protein